MEFFAGLIIGVWAGAFIGALAIALCAMARGNGKDYYA